MLRAAEGVFLPDVGVRDTVQEHVHLADGPGGADALLAIEREVARVAADLADVVASLDQHTARPTGWVVDAHARLWLDHLDQRKHDVGGGVELAGLLSGRVGEELDQVFVGRAEQVRELEVLVAQRDLLEVMDEVRQRVVVEGALADLAVEVDVLEHVLQRVDVRVLQRFECLVEVSPKAIFATPDLNNKRYQDFHTGPLATSSLQQALLVLLLEIGQKDP